MNDLSEHYIYLALYEADEVAGLHKLSPTQSGKIAILREQGYVEISYRAYAKHIRKQLVTPIAKAPPKKVVVVSTEKRFGVHGDIIHLFFTMVDGGETKQTLFGKAYSDAEVNEIIANVQAFFPDDYEFEFI